MASDVLSLAFTWTPCLPVIAADEVECNVDVRRPGFVASFCSAVSSAHGRRNGEFRRREQRWRMRRWWRPDGPAHRHDDPDRFPSASLRALDVG